MGESRKRDGFFGEYTEHFDDDGNKIGESREKEGVFGPYTEHVDAQGNKIGESRDMEGFFGAYTEHRDRNYDKVGESRDREGFFGPYREHIDVDGNPIGESREREGLFGRYTETTGKGWSGASRREEVTESGSSSSSSGCGPVAGVLLAIAAVVVIIVWLAVNIVLPVVLLNSALILTILAIAFKPQRTLFAALAIAGAAYMLLDVGNGWFSALFVSNVVKDPVWLTVFAYLCGAALGVSAWLLARPLWDEGVRIRDTNQPRAILLVSGVICLVGLGPLLVAGIYNLLPLPAPVETARGTTSPKRMSTPEGGQVQRNAPQNSQTTTTTTTDAGRVGSLLTNVNLRSCADRSCDSLGEQFKGGRFRIVEVLDKDGVFWYKIHVTQYGCHALNPNWCGKKVLRSKQVPELNRSQSLPGDDNASDEGWINSYNKDLNVYTVKLDQ